MLCPKNCGVSLQMTERQGVEIDYCPSCRGVWLDRGELDKIIERATLLEAQGPRAGGPAIPSTPDQGYRMADRHRDYDDDDDYDRRRRKKRGGFLGELFDFD